MCRSVLVLKFSTSGKHLSLRGARRAPKQSRKGLAPGALPRRTPGFAALAMTLFPGETSLRIGTLRRAARGSRPPELRRRDTAVDLGRERLERRCNGDGVARRAELFERLGQAGQFGRGVAARVSECRQLRHALAT